MNTIDQTKKEFYDIAARIRDALAFAETVEAPANASGLEIAGCVDVGDGCMERVDSDEHADIFSVYWFVIGAGADCFADFVTRNEARIFADVVQSRYAFALGVLDHTSDGPDPDALYIPAGVTGAREVTGSHGTLHIDADGNIIMRDCDGEPEYDNIEKFDVAEYLEWAKKVEPIIDRDVSGDDLDILEIGYWLKDGTYEEASEEFRFDYVKRMTDGDNSFN